MVARAVLDHRNIHRLVGLLKRDLVKSEVAPELMAETPIRCGG